MNVLFTSAALDSSGYAEASRNYICALSKVPGINLSARHVSFEHWKTDLGREYKEILDKIPNVCSKPDVQIIHLTPENFARHKISGIKNIGYTVWETTKLPGQWVAMCNQMDEIWVPCDWNVVAFKRSGVTVPVKKVPHTFSHLSFKQSKQVERSFAIPTDRFNFYSIFQWSARKNPDALLQAYWNEFGVDEQVCLVLKTFFHDNGLPDKERIKQHIQEIKKRLWLRETPPVVLIHDALSRDEILELHKQCNCFVLPHRAEGWGIPHFEAMAMGNCCISTHYSGNLEFMNDNNSILVNCNETPCFSMDRPTYNGKMMWGEPHIDDLGKKMRICYNSYLNAKESGRSDLLKENPALVVEKFSWENVGQLMARELGL